MLVTRFTSPKTFPTPRTIRARHSANGLWFIHPAVIRMASFCCQSWIFCSQKIANRRRLCRRLLSFRASKPCDVTYWHIPSFRCAAEFGRYRGITDIGQVRTNQARLMRTRPGFRLPRQRRRDLYFMQPLLTTHYS